MRTETIIKTYKTYNELTKEEQGKVVENFREHVHHDFELRVDDTIVNIKELLKIIGFDNIDINFTGFGAQGDGASFTASYTYNSNAIIEIKEKHLDYFDDINEIYSLIKKIKTKQDEHVFRIGRYVHECSIYCDNKEVQELARFISVIIYKELEAEYDYVHSLEYIEELINCNEYEFDSDTLELI
tara:strand:- start:22234 stop:22788 length:555 start_codon:yes stop_codon:yes gene_type:complete